MSYTQQEIDTLRKQIARGVTKAKIGDEEVTFASIAEMRRQLSIMEQAVAGSSSGALKVAYPKTSRGL